MTLSIHSSFLPHTDPEASLRFYRDVLGFDVRLDVGEGAMRWITLGAAGQPDTHVVLQPPVCDPGVTDVEAQTIADMMAKGTYAGINLASDDLDGLFQRLVQAGVEVVQEPKDQVYGLRDCAVRDPAGNLVRIQAREAGHGE
ncbi:VOC family protein [Brevibacterium gallinarum]|uniref:VOC family protein n=1 Tax=Brevibacterium gallinarum TaxID=2762220 RepID=A0ABR8WTA4_9MICO|nr:VOC family protein [Brevibacterium gallinarum]MBD8020259.1 VOC family protein [Brevibacterium gallinarum]